MNKSSSFTNYTIGENAYEEIEKICKKYGKTAVLIGGERALLKAEPAIKRALQNSEIKITGSFWYGGEAAYENVDALMKNDEIVKADMIFAAGGGKAIDTCKVLSEKLSKPLFTFPTIAATCAAITTVCAMYNLDGSFKDLFWKTAPQNHVFIDTKIIAEAPEIYLWAGMGDTLAKAYEPEFSARGRKLDYANSLGLLISSQCERSLVRYGEKALNDCIDNKTSEALEEVILAIIMTTGMASNYLINDYNSCVAHALCYGFSTLKEVEEKHLHGELVAYGVLVQLIMDKKYEEVKKLYAFYKAIGLPTSYKAFRVEEKELLKVAEFASQVNDIKVAPFSIDKKMILDSIQKLDEMY